MNTSLSGATKISGFIGACLVDSDSGLMLASEGGGTLDMDAVAALNTEFVKSKLNAIDALGLDDEVEDILITLGKQVHMIRPLDNNRALFIYIALDKKSCNLGMARIQLRTLEGNIKI